MRIAGLIVAAGRGERLGGDIPKQYQQLGSETILARAARALLAHPGIDLVRVVIHPADQALYAAAVASLDDPRLLAPIPGADTRRASVLNGLEALAEDNPDLVLIHDAARPFVSVKTIAAVIAALDAGSGAFPVLPVVDALWRAEQGVAGSAVPRQSLWRAQTPQGFRYGAILAAHRTAEGDIADDVAVARAAGLEVRLVPGEEDNFKITTPADLAKARARRETAMDIRTGNGFDVHALVPGDAVTLCGVTLPHDHALAGHSDADVGMHALTDAIFGALAEGDIGQWFPPSDPQWKGAASEIFLRKAVERAGLRGFAITHLDCTLICEAPKIGPHAEAMRAALAHIAGIGIDRVSVKATTTERLGFPGRGEGIAALATATLVRA